MGKGVKRWMGVVRGKEGEEREWDGEGSEEMNGRGRKEREESGEGVGWEMLHGEGRDEMDGCQWEGPLVVTCRFGSADWRQVGGRGRVEWRREEKGEERQGKEDEEMREMKRKEVRRGREREMRRKAERGDRWNKTMGKVKVEER
ncbi:hypothetical protein Pcinc_038016 [Petrolisthes cinctipes]|uniref:Uncharacterized protein n=1 Tax=Petrolisthes cinctipes TaxID=88211 RepID=A0AAE1BSD8_PETCI|nr:hypothetical protein Pcinc_038016 [Petrolisthes cinctipes]